VDERSPREPDSGIQRKYYAPNVGSIKVDAVGDPEDETLSLTKATPPSAATLDMARTEALNLDKLAAQTPIYRGTQPAHVH
jgi:hypothetical protein